MTEKGKEALNFVKRNNELKNQLKEELYKFEKKREVKLIEKENSNKIVSAFKEKEASCKKERIRSWIIPGARQWPAPSERLEGEEVERFGDVGGLDSGGLRRRMKLL